MFSEYAQPLRINLHSSRRLAVILPGSHLLAVIALLCADIPPVLGVVLSVALAFNLYRTFGLYIRRTLPDAVTELIWAADRSWQIGSADGRWQQASLRADSHMLSGLVLLSLQNADGKRWRIALLRGMLDENCWRRLRVRMRLVSAQFRPKTGEVP